MLKKDIGSNVESKPLSHSSFCCIEKIPNANTLARTSTSDGVELRGKCLCDRGLTHTVKTLFANDRNSLTRFLNDAKLYSVLYVFLVYFLLSSVYIYLLSRFTFTVVLEPLSNSLNLKTESVSLRARRARGEPYAKAVFSIATITVNATLNYKKKSKKQRHIVSRRKSNECKKGYECLYV